MAVGDSSLFAGSSYLAIGRETTTGTYNTCTAGLDFLSAGLKTSQDSKILETIQRSRTYSKRIQLSKMVEGSIESYIAPENDAFAYIMQNAFGGTVTSATATGETAGGLGFTHTFATGSMDQSAPSLCINMRKGPSAGQVFEYSGVRVNEFGIDAEIDDAVKFSAALVAMDSTATTNDVESALTYTALECLNFINGRISVENSFASLTSTSFWHVQSVSFSMNNSLKTGPEARRIGSATLDVLPPGIQSYTLSMDVRFDTTTAFDAMINATELAAELEFLGSTMTTSVIKRGLKLQFQKIMVKDAGDPEIGGPDEILTSTVEFDVLRDESATGYAVQALLTNPTSSYVP